MMIPMVAAMVLASSPVSMEFDGTLKDGLKQLAQKSGLNLVVIGDFDEKVNLNFPKVDGEEALETIAQAYGLEVTRSAKTADGKMWVIRRAAGTAVTPPVAVVPVMPLNVVSPEGARKAAEQAREAADRMREQADSMREKANSLKDEARQKAREQADVLREKADAMREQADEMREALQEAKEQAREAVQEAQEQAREQAEEAAEAEREQAEALREETQAKAELNEAQAEFDRHRVSAGGPVTIDKGSRVETAVAYGGPVIIEEDAVVTGDAVAFGGDVILKKGAVVEGDAVSFGGTVVRDPHASVHGESVSMGGAGIGTAVARNMVKTQRSMRVAEAEDADDARHGFGRGLAEFLLEFAALFGLGFVMMMFAPQRMKALEATIRAEPGKNGLVGVVGALAVLFGAAMLALTLVGIPLVMVATPALLLMVTIGIAAVANTIGARVPTGKMRKTQALVLAAGLFVMLLVWQIPVLGWMAFLVSAFISLGAIIRTRFGQGSRSTPMLDPMQTGVPSL